MLDPSYLTSSNVLPLKFGTTLDRIASLHDPNLPFKTVEGGNNSLFKSGILMLGSSRSCPTLDHSKKRVLSPIASTLCSHGSRGPFCNHYSPAIYVLLFHCA